MKGNPADLRELGNAIDRAIHDYLDCLRLPDNEDIAVGLFGVRNAIRARYDKINENRDRSLDLTGYDKNGDLIP